MKSSTDIWFIAFLRFKGIPLANFRLKDRRKVECFFELTDEQWRGFKVEFENSEIIKFKALQDQVKDLGF